jgi:hypothetical protein
VPQVAFLPFEQSPSPRITVLLSLLYLREPVDNREREEIGSKNLTRTSSLFHENAGQLSKQRRDGTTALS